MKKKLTSLKKQKILYDSRRVAKKFGKQHQHVLRKIDILQTEIKGMATINNLFGEFGNFQFIENSRSYRGQEFRYVEMGRKEFLLLATRLDSSKALEFSMINFVSMILLEDELKAIYAKEIQITPEVDEALKTVENVITNYDFSEFSNLDRQAEKIYHRKIVLNFEKIFPEYKYVQSEYKMKDGDIADILAKDIKTKRPVIIEIKIGSRSAHRQLRSYAYNFDSPILVNVCYENPKKQVQGIVYIECPLSYLSTC